MASDMKQNSKKEQKRVSKLKRILLGATALSFLSVGPLLYGEGKDSSYQNQKNSNIPSININLDFTIPQTTNSETIQTYTGYDFSDSSLNYFLKDSQQNPITEEEISELENLLTETKENEIHYYHEFLNRAEDFSEEQKLALIAAVSNQTLGYGYNPELTNIDIFSQEEYFSKLRDILKGSNSDLGTCFQISRYAENLADDLGIESAVINGSRPAGSHAFVISDLEKGISINDYYFTLIGYTKNVEDLLKKYKEIKGSPKFEHTFVDDGKFVYKLLTSEGKEFLDVMDYDISSEETRQRLLHKKENENEININISHGENINLAEVNYSEKRFGISGGLGNMKNIPGLETMDFYTIGEEFNFPIGPVNISEKANFLLGVPIDREGEKLYGIGAQLFATTDNKGFNFSSRIGGNFSFMGDGLFDPLSKVFITSPNLDLNADFGASYSINIRRKNVNYEITPYGICQFSLEWLGKHNFGLVVSEGTLGAQLEIDSGENNFSLDSRYTLKRSSHEFAGKIEYENPRLIFSIGGSADLSTYVFSPNRYSIDLGGKINLGKLEAILGLEREITDWNGDKESQTNFKIGFRY